MVLKSWVCPSHPRRQAHGVGQCTLEDVYGPWKIVWRSYKVKLFPSWHAQYFLTMLTHTPLPSSLGPILVCQAQALSFSAQTSFETNRKRFPSESRLKCRRDVWLDMARRKHEWRLGGNQESPKGWQVLELNQDWILSWKAELAKASLQGINLVTHRRTSRGWDSKINYT